MSDMKECPFCGSMRLESERQGPNAYYIFCSECMAEGPSSYTLAKSIELWNCRGTGSMKLSCANVPVGVHDE